MLIVSSYEWWAEGESRRVVRLEVDGTLILKLGAWSSRRREKVSLSVSLGAAWGQMRTFVCEGGQLQSVP